MTLLLIGANHRTAPVNVREQLAVSERESAGLVSSIRQIDGITGAAVLSTCNRMEILVSARQADPAHELVEVLSNRAGIDRALLERHLYLLRDADVVRHFFRVASGLDSMIVGEPQIGGQVRTCYRHAREWQSLDGVLQKLLENTMRVAKKVRSETGIGENAVSVPYAAVELARKIFGDLSGLRAMIIGAGKMGALTAEHLHTFGLQQVIVANRAHERAIELARHFDGTAIQFDELESHLVHCDIVIASTAAPHHVITADTVRRAMQSRKRARDIFLIDLSVPRNIDPEVARIAGAYLYNIDDLKEVADRNLEVRLSRAEAAEEIIEREVGSFLSLLASQAAIPTILELRTRLDEIRAAEVEKCLRRMGPISAEQRQAIEALTTGIVNKILHYPIVRLRESTSDEEADSAHLVRDTIRKIFGLT